MRAQSVLVTVVCMAVLMVSAVMEQAFGQSKYPSRQVSLVVPYAAGGALDIVARALAAPLEKVIGQSVVVVNRPGAAGAIGTRVVASAEPDGYTLLIGTTQVSVVPVIDELFGRAPSFRFDQFAPIARLSADPVVLVANARRGWASLDDLVVAAKANGGAIDYSSSGVYGATHLPVEMLARALAVKLQHVPAQGGGPAMTMALGNHVAMVAAHVGVAKPHIDAGTMRALVSFGDERSTAFPDTPTLKERGIDIEYYMWIGLFAPAKTPQAVQDTLGAAVKLAMDSDEFRVSMETATSRVAYQDATAFREFTQREDKSLRELLEAIGKLE